MGKPHLTEFLLKLATDTPTLTTFQNCSADAQNQMMIDAKLTDDQIAAITSWDSREIVEAVCDELEANASSDTGYGGTTLTIILPMDNLQHPHLSE